MHRAENDVIRNDSVEDGGTGRDVVYLKTSTACSLSFRAKALP